MVVVMLTTDDVESQSGRGWSVGDGGGAQQPHDLAHGRIVVAGTEEYTALIPSQRKRKAEWRRGGAQSLNSGGFGMGCAVPPPNTLPAVVWWR